jgi:hypothetical protein
MLGMVNVCVIAPFRSFESFFRQGALLSPLVSARTSLKLSNELVLSKPGGGNSRNIFIDETTHKKKTKPWKNKTKYFLLVLFSTLVDLPTKIYDNDIT